LLCMTTGFHVNDGDRLMLSCAVFFALHIMVVDRFSKRFVDGTLMACVQFFTAGLLMTVCMVLFEHPQMSSILAAKHTILYAGVMSCGVAYSLQLIGQRRTSPTVATMLMSLEAVIAALSGCMILHEKMSFREVVGCTLVFAAVLMAQLMTTPKQKTADGTEERDEDEPEESFKSDRPYSLPAAKLFSKMRTDP
ncbi:MAG: DMT family transporter, partial [Oscillospiraceae bacterium]|nr:DMT family transporter [Oscillospiraceae bacterium]